MKLDLGVSVYSIHDLDIEMLLEFPVNNGILGIINRTHYVGG